MSSSPAQHPSPERIFDTLLAFQQSAALKAALDLDLFTAIGKNDGSLTSLAKQTQASERGLRILCDYLVIKGFLTKQSGATDSRPTPPSSWTNARPPTSAAPDISCSSPF